MFHFFLLTHRKEKTPRAVRTQVWHTHTQEAGSECPSPQEKGMATRALCPSRGGHKDSYPTLTNPTQRLRGRRRAQAPSTDLEHQAKRFYKTAVPDFRGKALHGQGRGGEQRESHPLFMDDIWRRLLLCGNRAFQG